MTKKSNENKRKFKIIQVKKELKFKIGDVTDKGTVMDITESWKPEIYKQPLYYVTHTPEKYRKGFNCGIWKLGEELTLIETKLDASTNGELKDEIVNGAKPVLGTVDVKYLGVPNICFSLTDKDEKREIDFIKQRIERGFDDSETWSLRDSIALFILPRLKRYQEIANDFVKRDVELVNDIDCFIKAMELVSRDNGSCMHTPEEEKQLIEGLEKFPKIFMSLWW